MNINYHYFTIKTLALAAKFSEAEAQKTAHFSQLVDDFDLRQLNKYILTQNKPPQYFFEHGYAKEVELPGYGKLYEFISVATAIYIAMAISSQYQEETLLPYHFIPQNAGWQEYKQGDRTRLRCVKASACRSDSLILRWKQELANQQVADPVHIGMFLHTYADTYAHDGYSGLHGWENYSLIGKTTNHMGTIERYFYFNCPSIGHANVATLPDNGAEVFDYNRAVGPNDKTYADKIQRDNPKDYKICSREILRFLCMLNQQPEWEESQWDTFYGRIEEINQSILRNDEETTNISDLTAIWQKAFEKEGYRYSYDAKEGIKTEAKLWKSSAINKKERETADIREEDSLSVYTLSEEIYRFNMLAYQHLERVNGQKRFDENTYYTGEWV